MMMALTTLVTALVAFQLPGQTPDPSRDVLLTQKDAVFLLDPEVVAGSGVSKLDWSPDGTYLLVQREMLTGPNPLALLAQGKPQSQGPPAGEHQFVIYSAPSKKTVTALRLPLSTVITRVEWIPGSSKALVMAEEINRPDPNVPYESVSSLYWISANGDSRKIAQSGENEFFQLFPSPNRTSVVLSRSNMTVRAGEPVGKQVLQFLDAEGRTAGSISFTDRTDDLIWANDGKVYAAFRRVEKRKVVTDWYTLSPGQGTRTKVDLRTPPVEAKAKPLEFMVASGPMPSSVKGVPPAQAVFMATADSTPNKEGSYVFVSTDATQGALAPNSASVAYVHRGVAMVRPLVRLPKEAYIAMRDAALRAVAISNAKQAALAVIMNSADNDDVMVSANTDWREALMPYSKNRDLLNSFTYTFAGGSATAIENPATTEIGYTLGPGGRAVAYADGHVRWISDKP